MINTRQFPEFSLDEIKCRKEMGHSREEGVTAWCNHLERQTFGGCETTDKVIKLADLAIKFVQIHSQEALDQELGMQGAWWRLDLYPPCARVSARCRCWICRHGAGERRTL